MSKIIVTGAGGYLGSALLAALESAGLEVLPVYHNLSEDLELGSRCHALGEKIDPQLFDGVSTLIHCAWDLRLTRWEEIVKVNVEGSKSLFRAAKEAGVERIIFLSSMAAFEGCRSMYGKAKLLVEEDLIKLDGVSIRPGVVYGDPLNGILGAVDKIIDHLPLIPLIGSGKQNLYCVHKDDLCSLAVELLSRDGFSREPLIAVAQRSPLTFAELVKKLAARKGRNVILLPIPSVFVWARLKILEMLRLPCGLRSDSVTSMNHLNPKPDFSALDSLSINLRPFSV